MSPNCCGDVSPTFEKPTYREMEKTMEASRFVAQHVKNKDKFESVSTKNFVKIQGVPAKTA
jgi:nicotinic acetylcholine receptor, invertebrate